jgi:putative spermidine/putrescine transport system substrate-binding protein
LIKDSLLEYGFPSIAFGWVMAWNSKVFAKGGPQGWADFWDVQKFPGRRALYSQPKPLLEFALIADGVLVDKLYPLDVDRAFKKLDQIKPHISVWYEDLGQADVLLQNGEVDLMLTSNGRAYKAKQSGAPVDFTFKEGAWEQGYWVVLKNAPNTKNAMKLIAWTAQPDGEAVFAEAYAYGGPNLKSYAMMKPAVAAGLSTSPDNLKQEFKVDGKWWTDNLDAINRRWLEWRTAH